MTYIFKTETGYTVNGKSVTATDYKILKPAELKAFENYLRASNRGRENRKEITKNK